MSINGISGGTATIASPLLTGTTVGASTSPAPGSGAHGVIANVDAAASGVSAALASVSSALGTLINTTA
jgi:hypothetical protein